MRLVLFCIALLASVLPASAQSRVALVLGSSSYAKVEPLKNARRDAEAVSDTLRSLGFDVVEAMDADARAIKRAINTFKLKAASSDLSLFFYSGHGLQVFGENFLVPTDFDPLRIKAKADLGFPLDEVLQTVRAAGARRFIGIIDACRDNPLGLDASRHFLAEAAQLLGKAPGEQPLSPTKGLAPFTSAPSASTEDLYIFSAQPDRVAYDGSGENSAFAQALLAGLKRTDLDVTGMFAYVTKYVVERPGGGSVRRCGQAGPLRTIT